jgi:hypothetical protein
MAEEIVADEMICGDQSFFQPVEGLLQLAFARYDGLCHILTDCRESEYPRCFGVYFKINGNASRQ